MFSSQVAENLKYYVYRLLDPRNGETFYVGKGTGNRVFAHGPDIAALYLRRRVPTNLQKRGAANPIRYVG